MREYIVSRLSICVVLFGHLAFIATFVAGADPPAAASGETSSQTTPSSSVNEEALKQAESLDEQGSKALAAGRLDEAVDLRTRALAKYEKAYPAGHSTIAYSLHQLAFALERQGKSAESRTRYEKALEIHRQLIKETGDTNLRSFAMVLRNLAGLEKSDGQLQEAKEHLVEAIAIARLAHGNGRDNDGPAAIARNLSDLGLIYFALGDFKNAAAAHRESLAIYRSLASGGNSESLRSVVISLWNLGCAYYEVGNNDSALLCWLEAYNMQEQLLKSISNQEELRSGFDYLTGLSSKLVVGFQHAGKLIQAEGSQQRAVVTRQRALGIRRQLQPPSEFPKGSMDIAGDLNALGLLLREVDDWRKASECFDEASEMLELLSPAKDGSQPPVLLVVAWTNSGDAHRELGNFENAKEKCERALAAFEAIYPTQDFPKGHDLLAVAMRNLGSVLGEIKDFEGANDHLQSALAMQRRLYTEEEYPDGHLRVANTFLRLAHISSLQDDANSAYGYYQKALMFGRREYSSEMFPNGHPWMRRLLKQAARTARDLGQDDVAARYEWESESPYSKPPIVRLAGLVRVSPGQRRLIEEATLFFQDGQKLYREAKYEQAEVYLLRAYHIFEEAYPRSDYPRGPLDLADSLDWLAWVAMERQDFRKAKDYFSQSLDVLRRHYPESQYPDGHAKLKRTLDGLARAYVKLELYVESRTCYIQSLEIADRLYPKAEFPNGHESVAGSLNGLGTAYEGENKLDLARDFYQRSVDMRRQLLASKDDANIREHQAVGINNLAAVLEQLGDKEKAAQLFEEARSLSPSGSEDYYRRQMLSCWKTGENLLGKFDGEHAADHYSRAIEFAGKAYPKERFPDGHVDIARSLGYLGAARLVQGKSDEARHQMEAALDMLDAVARGDETVAVQDRANFLSLLGSVLKLQGENAEAKIYYDRAEVLQKRLASQKDSMPGEHSIDASKLETKSAGGTEVSKQERQLLNTLDAQQNNYPVEEYPNGHYNIWTALRSLGQFYREHGDSKKAGTRFEEAVAMQRKLYDASHSVLDANNLLNSLHEFAVFLVEQKRTDEARNAYVEAISLAEKDGLTRNQFLQKKLGFFANDLAKLEYKPRDVEKAISYAQSLLDNGGDVPQHGMWASLIVNQLAETLLERGMFDEAFELLSESTRLQNEALHDFSLTASEAETFNYIQFSQVSLDHLLSASQHMKSSANDVDTLYARVWERRGLIQEILGKRYKAAHLADQDRELHRLYESYLDTRRSLADTLAFQSQPDFAQAAMMMEKAEKLGRKKEEIERRIAREFPQTWKTISGTPIPHAKLVDAFPSTTAVIDFLWYSSSEPATGQSSSAEPLIRSPRYAAFVLCHGQPVTFVDLGDASRVDAAVLAWRKGLGNDALATEVSRLVWNPLSEHIPSEVETVYLCPDGSLTSLPWAALPVPEKQEVLLERHALAVIPSGRFLLDGLTAAIPPSQGGASFLAVGDVDYDSSPGKPADGLAALERGVAQDSARDLKWPALPGTKNEIDSIVDLLSDEVTAGSITTRVRTGDDASVSQVVQDLPGARWAHVSTHGFFAAPKFLSAIRQKNAASLEDPSNFNVERTSVVGRNPLVLSGLVLAGANSPKSQSGADEARGNSGILSAEAIAGLPLGDMQLTVLSACETGLGDVAGGEGVYGLQRAFHLAGAKNVVASLWKVDDTATAALMNVFYHKLWQESKTPLQALREAQLTIYRNPDKVTSLAGLRGAEFERSLRGLSIVSPADLSQSEDPTTASKTSPIRQWAAFMLSGTGR